MVPIKDGAIFDALFNKIINVHISWTPNIDWSEDGLTEMECFWYLREPFQLTLHCSGWINEDDYRESIYKQSIWWGNIESMNNWNLVSDYIYDPVDRHFCPDEEPNPWRGY